MKMWKKKSKHKRKRIPAVTKHQLDNSIFFDLELTFNKKASGYNRLQTEMQHFIDALEQTPPPKNLRPPIASGLKREQASRRNVETLLANVHNMIRKKKPCLAVSLSPHTYSYRKANAGIINLIKLAVHFGLFDWKKGFQSKYGPKESRWTRIWPTPKLYKMLTKGIKVRNAIKCEPDNLIELRRTEVKNIEYEKDGKTYMRETKKKVFIPKKHWEKNLTKKEAEELDIIKSILPWFNSVFSEYKITYTDSKDKKRILKPSLYTVYTDNFTRGGRIYSRGGRKRAHWQLTKEERKTIRFNGYPTTELDFGGLHIRILYHLVGKEYPLDKDPYAAVLEVMGKKSKKIFNQYPNIRDDLKMMLLALINSVIKSKDPIKTAARRANWNLFRKYKKKRGELECKKRKENWQKAGLLNRNGSSLEVIRAFYKAHKPIKKYFLSGCGLNLQKIDARIAFYVMFEMMVSEKDKCIPTLSIHDSFITFRRTKYLKKLRKTMNMIYQGIMQKETKSKRHFKIPVKG